MKKILVPTDFSANSRAGIRFALRWAALEKLELIFVHVLHTSRPVEWTDTYFFRYIEDEANLFKERLSRFVEDAIRQVKQRPERYQCMILPGMSADLALLDFCRKRHDIDFICMSTAGAGGVKKTLGTNTGNLITKSKVPVIAVPKNYKGGSFKKLMYATDFRDCSNELKSVVAFAKGLKASLEVLHFTWPNEVMPDKEIVESGMRKVSRFPLRLRLEKPDIRYSLTQNLEKCVQTLKPSVLIMFTDQSRNLLQKIFLSSKSEQLSFHLKTPLLVFQKASHSK